MLVGHSHNPNKHINTENLGNQGYHANINNYNISNQGSMYDFTGLHKPQTPVRPDDLILYCVA